MGKQRDFFVNPDLYQHIEDRDLRKKVYLKEYRKLYDSKIKRNREEYYSRPEVKQRKKEVNRISRVFRDYGISIEEYDNYLSNGCSVCGSFERLHLDHNHSTGQIRGCLCGKCNQALGLLQDDVNNIGRLMSYLLKVDKRYTYNG